MSSDSPYAALWAVLTSEDDQLLLIDWADGSRREASFFPVHDSKRYESMLAYHVRHGNDPKIGLAPRRDRHLDNLAPASVVWASVENPTSLRGLQAFRPLPTLTFKTGRTLRCLWWLHSPLPMKANPVEDWLTKANKRLAFALKANSRHADPAWLMPMGELIDADPGRRYTAQDVVGKGKWRGGKALQDAPPRRFRSVA